MHLHLLLSGGKYISTDRAAILAKTEKMSLQFYGRYISREYLKMAVLFMWLQLHISIDIMVLGFVIWLKTKAACGELPELKLWLPLSPSSAGGHTSPGHQHDHKLLDFISKCFPAVCSGWGAEQRKYFITFKLGQRIWAKFPVFCR